MSKSLVLMRDVIQHYNPKFQTSRDLRCSGLSDPRMYNIEYLVEQSLAHVGGYEFIDAHHADYPDGSDCKTASIRENPLKPGHRSYGGEISGVETAGGGRKQGALRCIIYNPHKDNLKFYFLPKTWWERNITLHPSSGVGKITYTYHEPYDHIVKFHGYECANFEELARA